ncbi:MAG: hypothetical protein LBP33_04515 [Candidatus Adiutrix sp.]|jgi:hypothetical protein|nr:hypothetical protein [Candidatus Adiutrix sp.]
MINSFIPGRVRIRDARFQDPETCAKVRAFLKSRPWLKKVSANPATGGLLIEYDPKKLNMEEALRDLAAVDPEGAAWIREQTAPEAEAGAGGEEIEDDGDPPAGQPLGPAGLSPEAAEYLALSGAFVVCASSAFLRSKGLHVYSGLTLAGLTIQHVYKYRKRLLALFRGPAGR